MIKKEIAMDGETRKLLLALLRVALIGLAIATVGTFILGSIFSVDPKPFGQELIRGWIQFVFVTGLGTGITVLTQHYNHEREKREDDAKAERERSESEAKVEQEKREFEAKAEQEKKEAARERERIEHQQRTELRTETLRTLLRAYNGAKEVRRLLSASLFTPENKEECILRKEYCRHMESLNRIQLEMEYIKDDLEAVSGHALFHDADIIGQCVRDMENYLRRLVSEYQKSIRKYHNSEYVPLSMLPRLSQAIKHTEQSDVDLERDFYLPSKLARELIRLEIAGITSHDLSEKLANTKRRMMDTIEKR